MLKIRYFSHALQYVAANLEEKINFDHIYFPNLCASASLAMASIVFVVEIMFESIMLIHASVALLISSMVFIVKIMFESIMIMNIKK